MNHSDKILYLFFFRKLEFRYTCGLNKFSPHFTVTWGAVTRQTSNSFLQTYYDFKRFACVQTTFPNVFGGFCKFITVLTGTTLPPLYQSGRLKLRQQAEWNPNIARSDGHALRCHQQNSDGDEDVADGNVPHKHQHFLEKNLWRSAVLLVSVCIHMCGVLYILYIKYMSTYILADAVI